MIERITRNGQARSCRILLHLIPSLAKCPLFTAIARCRSPSTRIAPAGIGVGGRTIFLGPIRSLKTYREHPIAALAPPDDDVLPVIEYLARFVAQLVLTHLRSRRAVGENLECFESDAGNPGIKRALPEFSNRVAAGRQHLPIGCFLRLGNGDLDVPTRLNTVDRINHSGNAILNTRPACRPDHHYRDPALTQILLVSQILVRRDQYLKACCFCLG
jgi:hypothetical protein